ncbi:hypothetical protein [Nocardiopsis sp. CNT312]|uniref:hypothetical protein n=1 Tax=Nocardiopsis sp. CNT312 TaxID=1137268 RepID=UPI00048FAF07|nr:hypothetical protein [Nocardiopsis sp. CNT312]
MISPPVIGAVQALQKQALTSHDTYELDRIDRALDELLRNPDDTSSTPTKHRIRSAMGHAYEVLERRRTIAPAAAFDHELGDQENTDASYLVVEIHTWLQTEPHLANGERALLEDLAHGHDATTMAQRYGVPLPRMRERISRARRRARTLWTAEEAAA